MIDFQLDEEQKMLSDAVNRFAQERMRKVFRDADEEGEIPPDIVRAGWEIGLLPTTLPEAYGGFGSPSAVTGAIAVENLAWGDLAIALSILNPGNVALPILLGGTEEQKEKYLPLFTANGMPRMAAALVEPAIHFDPYRLKTVAVRDGESYRLSGVKSVVALADSAELFLIYAAEDGMTQAFLVPAGAEGLAVGGREKLMGLRALPTFGLRLEDCRVPAENRLGGAAGIDFAAILNHSRVATAAAAVGVARAGFEYARDYSKNRVQFGEPIAHRQAIAFMLAYMAIDVDAARLLVWETAWQMDRGEDVTAEATTMKVYVDDMVMRVADQALQVLGGYGYIREYPVELWLRNARSFGNLEGLAIV
jgi:alkylation response protein AidB-like acyl-CoA dehydrogenase